MLLLCLAHASSAACSCIGAGHFCTIYPEVSLCSVIQEADDNSTKLLLIII